jgi:hypothetical protein
MEIRVKREVGDQLNADFNYMVQKQGVEVYEKVSQEPVVDSKVDVDDLIDKECLSKSEALEEVIRNKEQLMADYFRSLQTGDSDRMEEIKKQIKGISDKVYEEFLVDLDNKIIEVLKTLDMDKLLKEKKEMEQGYKEKVAPTVDKIEPPVLTQVEEEIFSNTPVQTTQEVAKIIPPQVDDEGLEEGIYNPNHSQNRSFLLEQLGIGVPATPSKPVIDESVPVYASIQDEMEALGIKPPQKKEERELDTVITEGGRTATLDMDGRIMEIDGVRLDVQFYNSLNFFKNMSPDEAYAWQVESNEKEAKRNHPNYDAESDSILSIVR